MQTGTCQDPAKNDALGKLFTKFATKIKKHKKEAIDQITPEDFKTFWTDIDSDQAKLQFENLIESVKRTGRGVIDSHVMAIATSNGLKRADKTAVKNVRDAFRAIYACQCVDLKNARPVLDVFTLAYDDDNTVGLIAITVSQTLSLLFTFGLRDLVKQLCFAPFRDSVQRA